MQKDTETSRGGSRQRAGGRPRAEEPSASPGEQPDAERIRVLAYEIYETRSSIGMLGDPVSDWLEAERRLSGEEPPQASGSEPVSAEPSPPRSPRSGARRRPAGSRAANEAREKGRKK